MNKQEERIQGAGHRQRLRNKLLEKSSDSFTSEELLELFLFLNHRRSDVKPLVKALFGTFKTLGGILAAHPNELSEIKGLGNRGIALIKMLDGLTQRLSKEEAYARPVLSNWEAVQHYCISMLRFKDVEELLVLFLDTQNRLITDEILSRGTINYAVIFPREIVKRALQLKAAGIIIVHNHPSDDPRPSKADIEMTKKIKAALELVDARLLDHLIIAGNSCISFKSSQLL